MGVRWRVTGERGGSGVESDWRVGWGWGGE